MSATFARKSSGLTKQISVSDIGMWGLYECLVFVYNLYIFPVYMFELPGANVPISIIIGFFLIIPIYFLYGSLGSIMPRSGGDYVYQSRGIHPIVALITTFGWGLIAFAWPAYIGSTYLTLNTNALGPYFLVVGSEIKQNALVGLGNFLISTNGIMILGVILLAFAIVLILTGMKWVVKIQRYVLMPAVIITAVAIPVIYLLAGSSTVSIFNSVSQQISGTPDMFHTIINGAKANGYATPTSDWGSTFIFGVLMAIVVSSPIYANFALGETKGAGSFRKLTLAYLIPGFLVAFGFLLPEIGLFVRNYGWDFTHAAIYASFIGVSGTAVNIPVTYGYFTLAATSNVFLQTLFILGYIAVCFLLPVFLLLYPSRTSIAASIDGFLPQWFSSVNQRLKVPINSIIIPAIFSVIALYICATSQTYGLLLLISIATVVSLTLVSLTGLAGILFPYRQKFIVKASPIAKYRWIMPLCGALVVLVLTPMLYWYYSVPGLALTLNLPGYTIIGVGTLLSVIIFVAMRKYKKRQGIDIMLTFKEIPPE